MFSLDINTYNLAAFTFLFQHCWKPFNTKSILCTFYLFISLNKILRKSMQLRNRLASQCTEVPTLLTTKSRLANKKRHYWMYRWIVSSLDDCCLGMTCLQLLRILIFFFLTVKGWTNKIGVRVHFIEGFFFHLSIYEWHFAPTVAFGPCNGWIEALF